MAIEIPGHKNGTQEAAADLSSSQYLCVRFGASGVDVAGAGEQVDGILQDKPEQGQAAEVMVDGQSKVVAGASFAKGAQLTPDANGKAIAATVGDYIMGTAMEASGALDEIASVELVRPGRQA